MRPSLDLSLAMCCYQVSVFLESAKELLPGGRRFPAEFSESRGNPGPCMQVSGLKALVDLFQFRSSRLRTSTSDYSILFIALSGSIPRPSRGHDGAVGHILRIGFR